MSSPAVAASAERRPVGSALLARVLVGLPDRIVVWALCAMVATSLTVVAQVFHPYTVFPLFLLLVVLSWRLVPDAPAATRTQLVTSALVLVLVVVWFLLQRPYVGELLSVRRDAAIYTLRGVWLMHHASPDVQLTQQLLDIKTAVPESGLDFGGETFRLTRYFQSTTVVPGLIAEAGWIGGYSWLLQADLIIGAVALLGVFAVARRMAGPLFALVPFLGMAAAVPMASFSRVPFTEPLSMISVMACLLGLWQGARHGRRAMWLLAGIGAGGVAVARIDGALVTIGAVVGLGFWGCFAVGRAERRRALAALGWFSLAAIPVAALGVVDLLVHSPDYFRTLKSASVPLLAAVPASIVLAAAVTAAPGIPALAGLVARHGRAVAATATGLVSLVMVAMILRPLYYTAHGTKELPNQIEVQLRQTREHLPVDGTRSYDEQSVTWLAWYHGWPAVILGCAAVTLAVWIGIRRRDRPIVLVTSVLAVNAALYLTVVSITPDQIWAMRRFLPVIEPGGLLMLAWGLQRVWLARAAIGARLARIAPGIAASARAGFAGLVVIVLAAVSAGWPALTWGRLFTVAEGRGQLGLVERVCDVVKGEKILLIGAIPVMGYYQPTFRNFCGSQVITMPKDSPAARIATVVSMWGPGPVHAVSFYPTGVPWTAQPSRPDFSLTYRMWESVLSHPVRNPVTERTDIYLGMVGADGRVTPS